MILKIINRFTLFLEMSLTKTTIYEYQRKSQKALNNHMHGWTMIPMFVQW